MQNTILRLPEVKAKVGLSRSSIYLFMKEGKFPQKIQISKRCIGWDSEAISKWVSDRINASAAQKVAGA